MEAPNEDLEPPAVMQASMSTRFLSVAGSSAIPSSAAALNRPVRMTQTQEMASNSTPWMMMIARTSSHMQVESEVPLRENLLEGVVMLMLDSGVFDHVCPLAFADNSSAAAGAAS